MKLKNFYRGRKSILGSDESFFKSSVPWAGLWASRRMKSVYSIVWTVAALLYFLTMLFLPQAPGRTCLMPVFKCSSMLYQNTSWSSLILGYFDVMLCFALLAWLRSATSSEIQAKTYLTFCRKCSLETLSIRARILDAREIFVFSFLQAKKGALPAPEDSVRKFSRAWAHNIISKKQWVYNEKREFLSFKISTFFKIILLF